MPVRQQGRHFVAGDFTCHARFIDPDQYGPMIRDNVVRGCVDCFVMASGKRLILLGKRCIEPWPDWWTFGGGIIPGESPEEACARTIERDLGIKVNPERFHFLDVVSLVLDRRQEPVKEHGCHDIVLFHRVTISDKEIAQIKMERAEYSKINKMERAEYSKIKWVSPEDILDGSEIHPALQRVARQLP